MPFDPGCVERAYYALQLYLWKDIVTKSNPKYVYCDLLMGLLYRCHKNDLWSPWHIRTLDVLDDPLTNQPQIVSRFVNGPFAQMSHEYFAITLPVAYIIPMYRIMCQVTRRHTNAKCVSCDLLMGLLHRCMSQECFAITLIYSDTDIYGPYVLDVLDGPLTNQPQIVSRFVNDPFAQMSHEYFTTNPTYLP